MITKITVAEADALLQTKLNTEKWFTLDDTKKQTYIDIAHGYLEFLGLDIPTPTPQCVIDAQALMAAWDVHNGISVTTKSGGEIIEAKVASIAVKYAEGTNVQGQISRVPMGAMWCLSRYGYTSQGCKVHQCKVGRA